METTHLTRDDRTDSFFQIGDLTRLIAEDQCGMHVDAMTHLRWRELLGLLREFDTLVDDMELPHAQGLDMIYHFDAFEEHYPHLSPEALPSDSRRRMLGRVAAILDVGARLQQTTDMDTFIALRVEEGLLTAELLADTGSQEVKTQPEFYGSFMPIMRSLGVTACLLDSLSDGAHDFSTGKISIRPDHAFRRRLRQEVKAHAGEGMRSLAHRRIAWQFLVMSLNRLKNRLRHGVTPYSSVHNLQRP